VKSLDTKYASPIMIAAGIVINHKMDARTEASKPRTIVSLFIYSEFFA
jgi:hypothetical protein